MVSDSKKEYEVCMLSVKEPMDTKVCSDRETGRHICFQPPQLLLFIYVLKCMDFICFRVKREPDV